MGSAVMLYDIVIVDLSWVTCVGFMNVTVVLG